MSVTIPKIKNTDKASADTFNAPLDAVEAHLNSILSTLDKITVESAIIAHDCIVDATCDVGSLVYFNKETNEFAPAIAVLDNIDKSTFGKYVESSSAMVVGMVVSMSSDCIADILISGRYKSSECVQNCLIEGSPGSYYLSSKEAGRASKDYGVVVQPVLTYLGGDDFIVNITHQMPYQYTGPIVRGVRSASNNLTAEVDDDGIMNISISSWEEAEVGPYPYAISSITGNKYKSTPVVTKITGTGSVRTMVNAFGEVTVGDVLTLGGSLDAFEYNLNGAKRSSDEILTYIVFPGGRYSSVTISRPIDTEDLVDLSTWVDVVNSGTCTMEVKTYFIASPKDTTGVDIVTDPVTSSISVTGSNGKLGRYETQKTTQINSSGIIISNISVDRLSSDLKMLRAGFTIKPSSKAAQGTYANRNDNSSLYATGVAAANITKDQVVGLNADGLIVPASCDNVNISAVGISTGDFYAGSVVKYTAYGAHTLSYSVNNCTQYFVGVNGTLVSQSPDSPSYSQRICRSIGDITVFVDIEEVIL